MTVRRADYTKPLARAAAHAQAWLDTVGERPVRPRATADEIVRRMGGPLPAGGTAPEDVIDSLADGAEPGLMAMPSGRFFGWVIGGTLPAALAADWLVSAWDQNTGLRYATPATAALEEIAGSWLLELFDLPRGADVGFTTGAMMANFTCLAAARSKVLNGVSWNVRSKGLTGAPRVRVLAGAERHETIDLALAYLGLGEPELVAADDQGRIVVDDLERALQAIEPGAPVIVCLQAGNLHSGAFDPMRAAIAAAHDHGAWVHIDGAFGLWAAAVPALRHLTDGFAGADSWATDAHKTLNVPYDCGIAIVADSGALRGAVGAHASYLISDESGPGDPLEKTPEYSRRARGVPAWAALRSLGRDGVERLIAGLVNNARALAAGIAEIDGADVLNDVDYTQVCVAFGDDARTRAVTERLIADGLVWMSGSKWGGREVLRISVSNWSTDDDDVRFSIDAVRRAAGAGR
ncbi:MAG: pyridoxal phosphate-dependent decarboxylase family protein [Candidatus Dormibacteria bacterium]